MLDRRQNRRKSILIVMLMLAVGFFGFAGAFSVSAQTYLGSETCGQSACHLEQYSEWKGSGHPYKLMESEQAKNRPIPLPVGLSWDDISWVIGGYKWKSRYIDNNGYIITSDANGPGNNQYNYLTQTWSNYHAGEVEKPYDCGACHTTGWVADTDHATDGTLTDNQGGLPGMHGTFAEGGIGCEACHGPSGDGAGGTGGHGSLKDGSVEACGTCHQRGGLSNAIPASGGFIRHHEQGNEILASPHKTWDCTQCHDPHLPSAASVMDSLSCENCHGDQAAQYQTTEMFGAGVECIDCHMAFATKSAQALGPNQGDVQTHLFNINPSADYNMFSDDGGSVRLETVNGRENEGSLSVDFACLRCHGNQDLEWAEAYATNFHSTDFNITPGISGTWVGTVGERDGEGWLLDVAEFFIAAFYTQDQNGDQTWVIGFGAPVGNTVEVALVRADGPAFGDLRTQAEMNETPFGTATFTFTSCTMGTVTITPNAAMMALGFVEYTTNISRLLETFHSCPGTG